MAESAAVAFGRYLKTLRERRGLSLDDVESLSRTFADPIGKTYLSRCENGRQKLAFSKMIALSRVYEVPPEVLVERMELDLELDRAGSPDTKGLDFAGLYDRGRAAFNRGSLWESYGYLRDALHVARSSELRPGFEDHQDQWFWAIMSHSSAISNLGRTRLALHELKHLLNTGGLDWRFSPLLHERLACTLNLLGERDEARSHADLAIRAAEDAGLTDWLGLVYGTRAILARDEELFDVASEYYKKAFQASRDAGRKADCARTLLNLADVYYEQERYGAARRSLAACERIAAPLQQNRTRTLARILLGLIDEAEGNPSRAAAHWRDAIDRAKRLKDRVLRFQAEFFLFRQAVERGDEETAASLGRRLRKISAWVPEELPELADFKRLAPDERSPSRKRVS